MSRKNILTPYKMFDEVSIAANASSDATSVINLDSVHILVSWSGAAPVGTLTVQARHRKENVVPSAPWFDLNGLTAIPISGASGSHEILMTQMPFTDIRLVYTSTSGTGNMTATIEGKVVGA